MLASVIVPVYNRQNFIGQCIQSLLNQTIDDYEIIVIDDGSTDATKEILRQFNNPKIKIIFNEQNKGPAYARNRGIEISLGDYIAFSDSDCIVEQNWLYELIKPFQQNHSIMITAGKIIDPQPKNYWELVNKGANFLAQKSGFIKTAIGCNMAVRNQFLKYKKFDESLFFPGSEETDLCLDCMKRGGKIYFTPNAQTRHFPRTNIKTTLIQQFHYGYQNTIINLKHKKFPYMNYGSWLLLGAIVISFITRNSGLRMAGQILFISYLLLVFTVSIISRNKTFWESIVSYPGFLLSCLFNFLGNLFCMLNLPKKYITKIFLKGRE